LVSARAPWSAQARLRFGLTRDASLDSARALWSAQAGLRSGSTRDASLDSARALWSAQARLRFGLTRDASLVSAKRLGVRRLDCALDRRAASFNSPQFTDSVRPFRNPKRCPATALQSTACYPKRRPAAALRTVMPQTPQSGLGSPWPIRLRAIHVGRMDFCSTQFTELDAPGHRSKLGRALGPARPSALALS